jgi:HSP20 family protein
MDDKTAKSELMPKTPVAGQNDWHPITTLRREMERLFDDFDGQRWLQPFRGLNTDLLARAGVPPIDLVERPDGIEITVELPGLDTKDVDVTIGGGGLTITGEKRQEKTEDKDGYHLRERRYGTFSRFVRLPEGVIEDEVDATFKNGVLTIKAPRHQAAKKTIAVKAA